MHIKNDFKQLSRDPIMLILFLAPLFMILVFKLLILFFVPFLQNYIHFQLSDYVIYIFSLACVTTPGVLGVVIGFLMLDDRDGCIIELMSITPLGRSGYLIHRLSFSFIATILYVILGYFFLNLIHIPFLSLILLSFLMGFYSIIIGLTVSIIATDKVKGLTFAKGLNIFMLFIFTDLAKINWLTRLAQFIPTYWVPRIINNPKNLFTWGIAFIIHLIYLLILLAIENNRKS